MLIHVLDGTYELFRHFYGLRRFTKEDRPFGGVVGVLNTVLQMVEGGGTHFGVGTDHVIESFRNDLWAYYKTGAGPELDLLAQFHPPGAALAAGGGAEGGRSELAAGGGVAYAAHPAAAEPRVEKICIWTPDKDLAQCVRGDRVVQVDQKGKRIRNEEAVRERFGVTPAQIPDYLALVGDTADGYPGIPGIGPTTAAQLLKRHGSIESFPATVLGEQREIALLFKNLATLRTDAPLFSDVDELRWRGPTDAFAEFAQRSGDTRLLDRCLRNAPAA